MGNKRPPDAERLELFDQIGRNVKKFRREQKLTQGQLARLAGHYVQVVSTIENGGTPTLYTIVKIAKALGITMNDLIPLEEKGKPHGN